MTEWAPIRDGMYLVSTGGEVMRAKTGRILSAHLSPEGYQRVSLLDNGTHDSYVHRLMAEAFIPNPDNLELVRHLDDDPTHNVLDNLAWGTHSDNRLDSVRNGTHANAMKTHCPQGHPYDEENTYRKPGKASRDCRSCKREGWRRAAQAKKDRQTTRDLSCASLTAH